MPSVRGKMPAASVFLSFRVSFTSSLQCGGLVFLRYGDARECWLFASRDGYVALPDHAATQAVMKERHQRHS